jgi:tetratricopeptide (TPR) repeat protein
MRNERKHGQEAGQPAGPRDERREKRREERQEKRQDERQVAPPLPARWTDLGSGGAGTSPDDIERRIGALLGKVPGPAPLGRAAHARVAARLLDPRGGERPTSSSWFGRLAMGSGLGLFFLLLSGAVIAAGGVSAAWWGVGAWSKRIHSSAPGRSAGAGTTGRDEAAGSLRHAPRAPGRALALAHVNEAEAVLQAPPPPAAGPVPPVEPLPAVEPRQPEPSGEIGVPAREAASRGAPAARPRAPAAGAPASVRPGAAEPEPSELAQETRLLGTALAELRQQHDGGAALATVNAYLGRFPKGTLLGEARRARIDALLLLGRRDEARRALDGLDLEPVGRGQELLLIRGELRAQQHCADAIADFDVVLRHAAPAPLAERALFGRAVCRQQEGQRRAAREDAVAYLARFPSGRFANAARRLVAGGESIPGQLDRAGGG